jgi:hypothetical protein
VRATVANRNCATFFTSEFQFLETLASPLHEGVILSARAFTRAGSRVYQLALRNSHTTGIKIKSALATHYSRTRSKIEKQPPAP